MVVLLLLVILVVLAGPGGFMAGLAFLILSFLFALFFGFSDHFRTTIEWVWSIQAGLFIAGTLFKFYAKRASEKARLQAAAVTEKIKAASDARHAAFKAELARPKTLEELDAQLAELRRRRGLPPVSESATEDTGAAENP